jgi:ATP-dependent DNA ligase
MPKSRPNPELPECLSPMLAQSGEAFDAPGWLFEIKWDGTRCLALVERDRLRLQNRRCIEMRERYPELACLNSLPPGTVLDGEIVVLEGGKPSFPKLLRREQQTDPRKVQMLMQSLPATFIAFDLLYLHGHSWMHRPLVQRKEALSDLLARLGSPHILLSQHVLEQGKRFFQGVADLGLEGIVAKRLDSLYAPGKRSPAWLKIKVAQTGEFDVLGYVRREGEEAVSALIVGEHDGGRCVYKAKVGSFSEEERRELFAQLRALPPLKKTPSDGPKDAQWRLTKWRCRVRYFEKTGNGKLRGPVWLGRTA